MRFLCFMLAAVMVPGPLWAAQNAVPSATYESSEAATHQVWQIEAERSQRHILNQMAQDMNDKASTRALNFVPSQFYNSRQKGPKASQIYARQLATKIASQVVGEIDQLPPVQRALARKQLAAVQQNWQNILSNLNADVRSPEQLAQIKASLNEFSQSMQNTAYYETFQKAALALQDEIEHLQFLTQTDHPELNDIVAFKEGAAPVKGELAVRLNEASEYLFLTGNSEVQQAVGGLGAMIVVIFLVCLAGSVAINTVIFLIDWLFLDGRIGKAWKRQQKRKKERLKQKEAAELREKVRKWKEAEKAIEKEKQKNNPKK